MYNNLFKCLHLKVQSFFLKGMNGILYPCGVSPALLGFNWLLLSSFLQQVVDCGALEALVICLEEFDPGVKESAAWALGYIARHNTGWCVSLICSQVTIISFYIHVHVYQGLNEGGNLQILVHIISMLFFTF